MRNTARKIGTALAIVVCLYIAVGATAIASRPLSPSVTIPEIEKATATGALAKLDGGYYEVQGSDDFARLFAFDTWEASRKKPQGEPAVSLRFAEEWIVEIHDGGEVSAYYGYTASYQKPRAYYIAPAGIAVDLSSFIGENGVPQDGPFLESAFLH